jgi:hypothetical protein
MGLPAPEDVWVVVAAYNEAKVIADVIADVASTGHRVDLSAGADHRPAHRRGGVLRIVER